MSLFGGIKVVSSLYHPMVQDGTMLVRSAGHPLVYWLARQLARIGIQLEPDVVWSVPRMVPGPAFLCSNTIYCHPSQAVMIKSLAAPSVRPHR